MSRWDSTFGLKDKRGIVGLWAFLAIFSWRAVAFTQELLFSRHALVAQPAGTGILVFAIAFFLFLSFGPSMGLSFPEGTRLARAGYIVEKVVRVGALVLALCFLVALILLHAVRG